MQEQQLKPEGIFYTIHFVGWMQRACCKVGKKKIEQSAPMNSQNKPAKLLS